MAVKVKRISDRGLTPRQLVKETPGYIKYNGGYVTPVKMTPKIKNGLLHLQTVTRTNELGAPPRRHIQRIVLLEGSKISDPRARVKIECDCEFHCFTCEVALYRLGAADIIHSNGEKPVVTNPKMIPLTCIEGSQLVHTDKGLVPIKMIRVGDKVLTLHGYKKVLATSSSVKECVRVTHDRGTLVSTADHVYGVFNLFNPHTKTPAWMALNKTPENVLFGYVPEKVRDPVRELTTVRKLEVEPAGTHTVYDLHVADANHFFANGLVVHNCKHVYTILDHLIRNRK